MTAGAPRPGGLPPVPCGVVKTRDGGARRAQQDINVLRPPVL